MGQYIFFNEYIFGGEATLTYRIAKRLLSDNNTVICAYDVITDRKFYDSLSDIGIIMESQKSVYNNIDLNQPITVITYTIKEHSFACRLFRNIKSIAIFLYPISNNVEGVSFYSFKPLRAFDVYFSKKYYDNLIIMNSVLFTSERIYNKYQDFLKLRYSPSLYWGIPIDIPISELKNESVANQYNSNQLLTVLRATFPLKSYIFGLIRDFELLLNEIRDLKLIIICTGKQMDLLRAAIGNNSSITLLEGCRYDELEKYICDSFLNIGHGTCVKDAAKFGVPSLVSIEFSDSNNTVGLYSETKTITGKADMNSITYFDAIKSIKMMTLEQYKRICFNEFELVKNDSVDVFVEKLYEEQNKVFTNGNKYSRYHGVVFKGFVDNILKKIVSCLRR